MPSPTHRARPHRQRPRPGPAHHRGQPAPPIPAPLCCWFRCGCSCVARSAQCGQKSGEPARPAPPRLAAPLRQHLARLPPQNRPPAATASNRWIGREPAP
jgi:hypothetical protein